MNSQKSIIAYTTTCRDLPVYTNQNQRFVSSNFLEFLAKLIVLIFVPFHKDKLDFLTITTG